MADADETFPAPIPPGLDSQEILSLLLERVIPSARRLGLDADLTADAFFLAGLLPPETDATEPERVERAEERGARTDTGSDPGNRQSQQPPQSSDRVPPTHVRDNAPPAQNPATQPTQPQKEAPEADAFLSVSQDRLGEPEERYRKFASPSARAVPNLRELSRTLRPLMRREPNPGRKTIDEERTIDLWADWGIARKGGRQPEKSRRRGSVTPAPLLRPELRRAVEIAFLVDLSPTMSLWWENAREIAGMLRWQGAFRDVRLYGIETTAAESRIVPLSLQNSGSLSERTIPVQELLSARGDRIVIAYTDGLAEGWRSGAALDLLYRLGKHQPVAVWHALPENLWWRTAFGNPRWLVGSSAPGMPNDRLNIGPRPGVWNRLRDGRQTAEGSGWLQPGSLPLPVVPATDPGLLGAWARLVTGRGGLEVPAVQIRLRGAQPSQRVLRAGQEEVLTAEQRISLFRDRASPRAQRFAVLASQIPLSPSILRLLYRTFQSRYQLGNDPAILAELLMSPLVKSVDGTRDYFEFQEGVSDLLLLGTFADDIKEILDRVEDEIGKTLEEDPETRRTFEAYVKSTEKDPAGEVVSLALLNDRQRFAHLRARALHKIGLLSPQEPQTPILPPLPQGITRLLEVELPATVQALRWTADGSRIAVVVRDEPIVRLWREDKPGTWVEEQGPHRDDSSVKNAAWSPDGQALLLFGAGSLQIYRHDESNQWHRDTLLELTGDVRAIDLYLKQPGIETSENGRAATLQDDHIRFWFNHSLDVFTTALQFINERLVNGVTTMRWSRSGTHLFFGTRESAIGWIKPGEDGEPFWIQRRASPRPDDSGTPISVLQWAPPTAQYEDGLLAAGTTEGAITVHELHGGYWSHRTLSDKGRAAHVAPVTALNFSPSADIMASTDATGRTLFWRCDTWDFIEELNGEAGAHESAPADWSGTGVLATSGGEGRILRLMRVELLLSPMPPKQIRLLAETPKVFLSAGALDARDRDRLQITLASYHFVLTHTSDVPQTSTDRKPGSDLQESDVCILIAAHALEPSLLAEYRAAQELGIPCFVYLQSDPRGEAALTANSQATISGVEILQELRRNQAIREYQSLVMLADLIVNDLRKAQIRTFFAQSNENRFEAALTALTADEKGEAISALLRLFQDNNDDIAIRTLITAWLNVLKELISRMAELVMLESFGPSILSIIADPPSLDTQSMKIFCALTVPRILRTLSDSAPLAGMWRAFQPVEEGTIPVINRRVCRDAIKALRLPSDDPRAARVFLVTGPPRSGKSFTARIIAQSLRPELETLIYIGAGQTESVMSIEDIVAQIMWQMGAELPSDLFAEKETSLSRMLDRASNAIQTAAHALGKVCYLIFDIDAARWGSEGLADLVRYLVETVTDPHWGEPMLRVVLLESEAFPREIRFFPRVLQESIAGFTVDDIRNFFEDAFRHMQEPLNITPQLPELMKFFVKEAFDNRGDNVRVTQRAIQLLKLLPRDSPSHRRIFLSGPLRAFAKERQAVLEIAKKQDILITARENHRAVKLAHFRTQISTHDLFLAVTTALPAKALNVGKGGTEEEYRNARSAKKRCLIYLKEDLPSTRHLAIDTRNRRFTPLCELVSDSDENQVIRRFRTVAEFTDLVENDLTQILDGVWPPVARPM